MAIHYRGTSQWRDTRVPSIVDGGGVRRFPHTVWWCVEEDVWIETWPLQPGPAQSLSVTSLYRNDRIEIDGSWSAPASGAEVTEYRVRLHFYDTSNNHLASTAWTSRTPEQTMFTWTNGEVGWQSRSGQSVRMEVVPYSGPESDRRAGDSTTTGSHTVATLPAPPAPTAWVVTVNQCVYAATWSYTATNRCTGFQVETWVGSNASTTYNLAANARSHGTYPWNAATLGRTSMTSRIRATGPGGNSAWVSISGTIPGPVTINSVRFLNGWFRAVVSNNLDGVRIHTHRLEDNWTVDRGRFTGNVTHDVAGSNEWARDNSLRYRFLFTPEAANGWTGRQQSSSYCRKIPNPVFFTANHTDTWRNSGWRSDVNTLVWQGTTTVGTNRTFIFYGTKVKDYFSAARIGYSPTATAIAVALRRSSTSHGSSSARSPVMWLADQGSKGSSLPNLASPHEGPGLLRGASAWVGLRLDYGPHLIAGTWPSLGIYSTDTTVQSSLNGVSNSYIAFDRHNQGTHEGHALMTLRMHHDA